MKIYMFAFLVIWFTTCNFQNLENCKENVCLISVLSLDSGTYFVEFDFKADEDVKIAIDKKAFFVGCPLHQEVQFEFDDLQMAMATLKFSQLIIENEKGEFRVFSTQRWYWPEDEEVPILHVNCSLFGYEYFEFGNGARKIHYRMKLTDIRDLMVSDSDRKVRFHYYFKPNSQLIEEGYEMVLISSNSWIKLPR